MNLIYLKKLPKKPSKQIEKLKKVARGLCDHFGGAPILINYGPIGASCSQVKGQFNRWASFETVELTTGHLHCLN
jgi:hypothetical protein